MIRVLTSGLLLVNGTKQSIAKEESKCNLFWCCQGTKAVKACLVKCMQHFNAKSCTIVVGKVLHMLDQV